MLLWPAAGSVFAVYNVFQTGGLDYRLVALGALLPILVDLPAGEQAFGHTLLLATAALLVVMLATPGRGRRLLRRRWIGIPIGWYAGLVLLGAWRTKEVFWWPAFGTDFPGADLFAPPAVLVALELLGLAAARWLWLRCELSDPARRRAFWRTGRLAVAPL